MGLVYRERNNSKIQNIQEVVAEMDLTPPQYVWRAGLN